MLANVNGTQLYYTTMGQGRPLMFMHGGLGLDQTLFLPWMELLAKEFQLIFYDHRGNGRSERPASLEGVTHDTWAADADALRQHLGFDKIVLLGHSYGGFLGQEYALRYQEHLAGLILISTAPDFSNSGTVMQNVLDRSNQQMVETVASGLSKPFASDQEYADFIHTIFPLYFKNTEYAKAVPDGELYSFSSMAHNYVFSTTVPQFNVTPQLGQIKVPTLVIAGADDWITPAAESVRIHEAIPGSELVVFQESGHMPFIEEQDAFIKTVRDWVNKLPA
jgi:proline iminopeptidase